MPAKPKPAAADVYAVTAINHETGETWSIHDTAETCERELNAKLATWTRDGDSIHVTTSGPEKIA